MCLEIKNDITAKIKQRGEYITCYKIFEYIRGIHEDGFYSPYFAKRLNCGFYTSDREYLDLWEHEYSYGVSRGIHVFLNKEDAEKSSRALENRACIPCKCLKEDLVAGGYFNTYQSAVYMKVEFLKEDVNKATEEMKCARFLNQRRLRC